jgi:hypothetical protein
MNVIDSPILVLDRTISQHQTKHKERIHEGSAWDIEGINKGSKKLKNQILDQV